MRILLIHNRYQQYGGEDAVFDTERKILEDHGQVVSTLVFDNADIKSVSDKARLSYRLIYNRDSALRLNDAIVEFQPDVIHVHNFFYVASPSIFYQANKRGIPVVLTLHNYRLICSGSLLMRDAKPCELCIHQAFPFAGIRYKCHRGSLVETMQLTITTGVHKMLGTWDKKITLYVALTPFAREKFMNSSLHLSADKILVKPNSVDDTGASPPGVREDFFLFIGRLSKEKGIDVLLHAFGNSKNKIQIIGDGPMKADVERAASQNANIEYLGYQKKDFIVTKLKKCKALIVPSVWYEGLPTTVLEAFATGTPVIASDINNLKDIVIDSHNGLHFQTNNAGDLWRAVENFAAEHHRYDSLYDNARKTYLEKYTHETNYLNLIRVYEKAVGMAAKNAGRAS